MCESGKDGLSLHHAEWPTHIMLFMLSADWLQFSLVADWLGSTPEAVLRVTDLSIPNP